MQTFIRTIVTPSNSSKTTEAKRTRHDKWPVDLKIAGAHFSMTEDGARELIEQLQSALKAD
jgi:hypothetical protein